MTHVLRRALRSASTSIALPLALVLGAAGGTFADSDNCASATLVAVPGTYSGTTSGANADGSDGCVECSTPDVWVKFTSPIDQDFLASTCNGATWDTLLSLHTGCPGNAANAIACNDDACSRRSSLRVEVAAGSTYYLRISGWCGENGAYTVNLSFAPTQPPPAEGPDVIVGDITNSTRYSPFTGITAYSFGATSCNIGTEDANWDVDTPGHPLVHQAIYRLKDGRIEQLGQSWLKHTFGTIDNGICGTCNGHLGQILGVGCSDPYVASQNGDRNLLGPKWEVNATTGVYPYPYTSPSWSSTIARRLQVLTSEIDPAQNAGAVYYAEVQYITADDAQAGNGLNNASYRQITLANATSTPTLTGSVFREEPVINAWKAADPSVIQVNADYIDQDLTARFIIAAKVTDVGGGNWQYEYAVRNLNSHRSAQAFSVPLPAGTQVSNRGFRDVAYHSGDGINSVDFSGVDWANFSADDWLIWSTQAYADNPNANALRWGTQYNFWFRSTIAPSVGEARITLFRPGMPGDIDELFVPGLPIPTVPTTCAADFDGNGIHEVPDIFAFLSAWFAEDSAADIDGVPGISVPDIFAFLSLWFAGCP